MATINLRFFGAKNWIFCFNKLGNKKTYIDVERNYVSS